MCECLFSKDKELCPLRPRPIASNFRFALARSLDFPEMRGGCGMPCGALQRSLDPIGGEFGNDRVGAPPPPSASRRGCGRALRV